MEIAKERTQVDAECTADEVEQEATCYQKAIGSIFDATAKKFRISTNSRRWWNDDITDKRIVVG